MISTTSYAMTTTHGEVTLTSPNRPGKTARGQEATTDPCVVDPEEVVRPWEENKSKAKECDGSFLLQQKKQQAVKNSLMEMQMGAGDGLEGAQKEKTTMTKPPGHRCPQKLSQERSWPWPRPSGRRSFEASSAACVDLLVVIGKGGRRLEDLVEGFDNALGVRFNGCKDRV